MIHTNRPVCLRNPFQSDRQRTSVSWISPSRNTHICTCFCLDSCSQTCLTYGCQCSRRAESSSMGQQDPGHSPPQLSEGATEPQSHWVPGPSCPASLHSPPCSREGWGLPSAHLLLSWAPVVAWQGSDRLLYSHYFYLILWVTTFSFI